MGYLGYFNLKREPFSNSPDRRFFFDNDQHSRALRRLEYVVEHSRGFALCTGPIGHGKTTLARRLYDMLREDYYHKALLVVIHSDITADWLLLKFAKLLGVKEPKRTKVELLGQIYMRLRAIDAEGRNAVILIDEAQMLKDKLLMEEFRGLLNIELKGRKLINFIFFGLPEIEDCLKLDEPLRQRVALRVALEPYTEDDTVRYVRHRMQVAGGSDMVFSNEVMELIHKYSKGTPRLVNTLCDNLLLESYFAKEPMIKPELVKQIAKSFHLVEKEIETPDVEDIISDLEANAPYPNEPTDQDIAATRARGDMDIDNLIDMLEK